MSWSPWTISKKTEAWCSVNTPLVDDDHDDNDDKDDDDNKADDDDDDDDADDDDVNDHDDGDGDGGGHLAASSPVTHCRETEQKWRGMLNIIFIKIQIFIWSYDKH